MIREFSTGKLFFSAAECDALSQMSYATLAQHIILAATYHANHLGVGYADLIKDGNAWVLSRLSIEMEKMPQVNSEYELITWIESFNRHLSHRNFAILDGNGNPLGHARSLWACINIASRRPASLSPVEARSERECPIDPFPRMQAIDAPTEVVPYSFVYSDIDFNGHVNTARWIELLMNCRSLDWHKDHDIKRFDLAFQHEAFYGQSVNVNIATAGNTTDFAVVSPEFEHLRARITLR